MHISCLNDVRSRAVVRNHASVDISEWPSSADRSTNHLHLLTVAGHPTVLASNSQARLLRYRRYWSGIPRLRTAAFTVQCLPHSALGQ